MVWRGRDDDIHASSVDSCHIPFVVTFAGGRREVVQPLDLVGGQLDAVGGGVLLDSGNPLGAGDRRGSTSREATRK